MGRIRLTRFDELSRRDLLKGGAMTAAAAQAVPGLARETAEPAGVQAGSVELSINGEPHRLDLDPRTTLLDTLRERIGLTGTKKGCDHGQCGACTVLIDGEPALSCLTLAAGVRGEVTTIEGVGTPETLHPMQEAFIDHDAFQCGYCTSGQIMSAIALANGGSPLDEGTVREQMSGNLCRCAAYPQIVAAVLDGATRMKERNA